MMTFYTAGIIVFIITSVFISLYDMRTMHIPLWLLYAGLLLSAFFFAIDDFGTFLWRCCGAVSLFVIFFLTKILTRGKLGLGDLQYSIYCGLVSSFPSCFYSLLISCLICTLFLSLRYLITKKKKIYFTPFMFLGSIFVVFLL